MTKCYNCGKEFVPKLPNSLACSNFCASSMWEKKQGVLDLTGNEDKAYIASQGYFVKNNRLEKISS